jgi:hypothetical protein
MHLPKRRILISIGSGLLFLLAAEGLLLYGPLLNASYREYKHRLPFDGATWQDIKRVEGDDPIRIRMVDDLIRSRRLDRISRTDVEKLLGKPTATNYFKDQYDMVYWLGPERGFMGIDSEWLAISLDRNGVVRSYNIVHD